MTPSLREPVLALLDHAPSDEAPTLAASLDALAADHNQPLHLLAGEYRRELWPSPEARVAS